MIWGYQRKRKAIALALKKEATKKNNEQCRERIERLLKAGRNCSNKIKQLKSTRKKGNRINKKNKRSKRSSKYTNGKKG